ncbi:glycosyltransferase family 1 protein [Elioraea sp.]|uniref:glycosyltransferase family 4 protein n=1 Tax=Elioraea sp. TaxID=2185103 RepID=UPI0025BDD18A|nr:glycosyltransferase family 1 protein [Elioraea sp.]
MRPLVLNGRFLTQGLTGVQRFAIETTRALDDLVGEGAAPPIRLLAPPGAEATWLSHIRVETVGSRGGQAWEQIDLPRAAQAGFIVNLGNTGPIIAGRNQAVVIHDAGAFDTPESYSFTFRTWYRALHRILALRGAQIVTVSKFSRGRIAANLGIQEARIGVMAEGGEHILRETPDMSALQRNRLVPGRFALAVGTRAAHKNLGALAAAAEALAARGLVIAAAGAADPAVFRPAGQAGGKGAVALGRVSDAALRALYENAFCLVFPSRYEGFGLPPVEAMASGCPVIASRAGAVPEVCGDAALWFDPADPASLPTALARLLDEPGLAATMREQGLARAAEFTWAKAAERLLALIGEKAA